MMSESKEIRTITDVCPTVAALLGIRKFNETSEAMEDVLALVDGHADRVLMYNPDAVAWWVFEKYNELFAADLEIGPLVKHMGSVMPSVTPVCFASMYTGLMPENHGIRKYEKPVLKCKTLFDVAIEAGIRPIIIGDTSCSISNIFLERDMDYYRYDTIEEINAKAEELIRDDASRLIIVYNGDYDANMHRWGPEGEAAIDALKSNIAEYRRLNDLCGEVWGDKGLKWISAFATDHGCHEIDGGCGSHGLDMEEDMNVVHMWYAGK